MPFLTPNQQRQSTEGQSIYNLYFTNNPLNKRSTALFCCCCFKSTALLQVLICTSFAILILFQMFVHHWSLSGACRHINYLTTLSLLLQCHQLLQPIRHLLLNQLGSSLIGYSVSSAVAEFRPYSVHLPPPCWMCDNDNFSTSLVLFTVL